MNDFSFIKLKDITTKIGSGATPLGGKKSYKATGISLIRSLNVYDLKFDSTGLAFIDKKQASRLDNVKVESQDILLNITGASVARCCMVPDFILPARVNQHVSIIRIDTEQANPCYILYCLVRPYHKNQLLMLAQGGATREALTKTTIENFEVPFPERKIQDKIAYILSCFDDLVEANSSRIRILEEFAHCLYNEWFVYFRFPEYEKAKIIDSEFGKVPEGWQAKKIKDICSFVSRGVTPEYRKGSGRYIINQKANRGLQIERSYLKELKYDLDVPEEKFAHKGDLLINSLGEGTIGRVHHFRGPHKEWAVDQHMTICRSENHSIINYLYYKFSSKEGQERMQSVKTGATNMTMLNISVLRNMKFIIPSKGLLEEFFAVCSSISDLIYNLENKNNILIRTRNLLLPRLISGRINVDELDTQISGD